MPSAFREGGERLPGRGWKWWWAPSSARGCPDSFWRLMWEKQPPRAEGRGEQRENTSEICLFDGLMPSLLPRGAACAPGAFFFLSCSATSPAPAGYHGPSCSLQHFWGNSLLSCLLLGVCTVLGTRLLSCRSRERGAEPSRGRDGRGARSKAPARTSQQAGGQKSSAGLSFF